jgi:hypothetical protein
MIAEATRLLEEAGIEPPAVLLEATGAESASPATAQPDEGGQATVEPPGS